MAKSESSIACETRTLIFRAVLFVSYVCFGSGMFHLLERDEASREVDSFEEYYNKTMKFILSRFVSNETEIELIMQEIRRLEFLQNSFPREWDYLGGVNISISAITTIGYGNTVPKTTGGRIFLIVYATIGIPIMGILLNSMGEKLKHTIRSSITSFEKYILKTSQPQNIQKKCVIAVFFITVVFLSLISAISVIVENWDFSLALYVWFVTFTTIGFGDYIPRGYCKKNTLVALEFVYLFTAFFLGLTLIATILHVLSDWVNSKKPPTNEELKRTLGRMANSLSTHKEEIDFDSYDMKRPRDISIVSFSHSLAEIPSTVKPLKSLQREKINM